MTVPIESWGTFAAVRRSDDSLVGWIDAPISQSDAAAALGRVPDFADGQVISWGRLSPEEMARVLDFAENASTSREVLEQVEAEFSSAGPIDVSLYFHGPHRGY